MDILSLKKQYNQLLHRHDEGKLYLDNPKIPFADREKQIPLFRQVCEKMNDILTSFERQSVPFTEKDALYGFEEVQQ